MEDQIKLKLLNVFKSDLIIIINNIESQIYSNTLLQTQGETLI
jgi:hypothetical protein